MAAVVAQSLSDGPATDLAQETDAKIAQHSHNGRAIVDCLGLATVTQGQSQVRRRVGEQANILMQRGLVLFDDEQVVPEPVQVLDWRARPSYNGAE